MVDSIVIYVKEIGFEVPYVEVTWWALVETSMKFQVPFLWIFII
jgi:hypothetical protein